MDGTVDEPDCKNLLPGDLHPYPYTNQLLVHEARHSDPADPRHVRCDAGYDGDATLEDGSGYAFAALYLMWVWQYGLYDPPETRSEAGWGAYNLLRRRICSAPTHSDPVVQAVVDELLSTYGRTSH